MSVHNPLERRNINERRTSIQGTQFPIITLHGVCVRKDRRKLPERRIAKIIVDEKLMPDEDFELIFAKYRKNNFGS